MIFGCSETTTPEYEMVNLAGTVTVQGVPVESGKIRFSPIQSDQAKETAEGVITNGQYSVSAVPVGDVTVTFTGVKKTGRVKKIMGSTLEETINIIPAKYSRGISVAIRNEDKNDRDKFNFDLK